MPSARRGRRRAWRRCGEVDTACSSRTRVGSARQANHSAYVAASRQRCVEDVARAWRAWSCGQSNRSTSMVASIDDVDIVMHRHASMNSDEHAMTIADERSRSRRHPATRSWSSAPAPSAWPPPPRPTRGHARPSSSRPAPSAGAAVREWGHVRLFSPWSELVDPVAEKLLDRDRLDQPRPGAVPDRSRLGRAVPAPLADALAATDRASRSATATESSASPGPAATGWSTSVATRCPSPSTSQAPDGPSESTAARRHRRLRHLGHAQPARRRRLPGHRRGRARRPDHLRHPRPRPTPRSRQRYAGKHVAVAGRGASAQNALVALTRLAERAPGHPGHAGWSVAHDTATAFGGGDNDQLEPRGALGKQRPAGRRPTARSTTVHRLPHRPRRRAAGRPLTPGRRSTASRSTDVDEVVVVTGFRPDHSWLSEVRLDLDGELSGPVALAPLDRPQRTTRAARSTPHGANVLAPARGRPLPRRHEVLRPRAVVPDPDRLRADPLRRRRDRRRPRGRRPASSSSLPDTGVCGGSGLFDESADGGCCAPAAAAEPQLPDHRSRGERPDDARLFVRLRLFLRGATGVLHPQARGHHRHIGRRPPA